MERVCIDLTGNDFDEEQAFTDSVSHGRDDNQGASSGRMRQRTKPAPRSALKDAIDTFRAQGKWYEAEELEFLPRQRPTKRQIALLEAASGIGPNYLGRTASSEPGTGRWPLGVVSNGRTAHNSIEPGAVANRGYFCRPNLLDMTQAELINMIGAHLIWQKQPGDEFTSHSSSTLYLIANAIKRSRAGAKGVTVQFFDRRKATHRNGEPARFYPALELFRAFEIAEKYPVKRYMLGQPGMFTHEYLSHGTLVLDMGPLVPATIEELLEKGLMELLPRLTNVDDIDKSGLGGKYRKRGFPGPDADVPYNVCTSTFPITVGTLQAARRLALCFVDNPQGSDQEPPLGIFLHFLSFHKRQRRDVNFLNWIVQRYTRK